MRLGDVRGKLRAEGALSGVKNVCGRKVGRNERMVPCDKT